MAPPGHSLVRAQLPLRPLEAAAGGRARLECLLDLGVPGWHGREVWCRQAVASGRSGALDLPGRTWRDRPAVDRGDDVFLAGDMVAAPVLLAEVACTSALAASRRALRALRAARTAAVSRMSAVPRH